MKIDKLKKEIQFRMNDLYHPETMAAKFLLCRDDNELIDRINKKDESALLQFAIKHINSLIKCIIKSANATAELRLMDEYLPYFVDQIKLFAEKYTDEKSRDDFLYVKFEKFVFNHFYDFSMSLNKRFYNGWADFEITNSHVDFLNHLNDFLSNAEGEIIERAKIDISFLEEKLKNPNSLISDYEYFVEISYFSKNSDGNAIYEAQHSFNIRSVMENNWGLLCDGEDWRERGWLPELKNRCCYLMHEVVYHSHICQQIFDIDDIWIDTKVWNQSMYSFKNEGWEFRNFAEGD